MWGGNKGWLTPAHGDIVAARTLGISRGAVQGRIVRATATKDTVGTDERPRWAATINAARSRLTDGQPQTLKCNHGIAHCRSTHSTLVPCAGSDACIPQLNTCVAARACSITLCAPPPPRLRVTAADLTAGGQRPAGSRLLAAARNAELQPPRTCVHVCRWMDSGAYASGLRDGRPQAVVYVVCVCVHACVCVCVT